MHPLYPHIAVASTFSPRFLPVLAKADRIASRLGGILQVIHAAAENGDAIERFFEAFQRVGRPEDTGILWAVADRPTEAILSACERGGIDLLLAGALEREGDHRNFVGGVARELLNRANCDLWLMPEPTVEAQPLRRVVVEVDLRRPSLAFLNRACAVASRMEATEMVFVATVTPFDEARTTDGPLDDDRLAACVDPAEGFEGVVDLRVLRSSTGFGTCDFLQEQGADLFIVARTPDPAGCRLPSRVDWLRQVIPTDVLITTGSPA